MLHVKTQQHCYVTINYTVNYTHHVRYDPMFLLHYMHINDGFLPELAHLVYNEILKVTVMHDLYLINDYITDNGRGFHASCMYVSFRCNFFYSQICRYILLDIIAARFQKNIDHIKFLQA